MTLPALVLVHGGAVDLPGRRGKPGDLCTLNIADWVNSVVGDIEDAQLNDVVIVGHSMAGLTVPGVVAKLGGIQTLILIDTCHGTDGQRAGTAGGDTC
jgi:surfactin synthase thioesterase subunit